MDGQINVVIDADFFRNITEYEQGTGLFLRVMNDLEMKPIMHEFVANVELKGNIYLQQLLDMGIVSVIYYKDYLKEEDKAEYAEYFIEAYEHINHFDFLESGNIYEYADKNESLGEIRSLYMARKMGYIYFMSDDADAKTLARNFFSSKRKVTVKSLFDVLAMCKEKNIGLRWKDINPTVSNAMRNRRDKISRLQELYVE
ncbi:MAG: hypothetical protein NC313_17650 [Butyrivibrio sp.]|nr:hypothetical protein [Butyrivibrio sp.]